jgi:hypothetical protein
MFGYVKLRRRIRGSCLRGKNEMIGIDAGEIEPRR